MKTHLLDVKQKQVVVLRAVLLCAGLLVLAACSGATETPSATPTIDPDIFNQVPTTTFFEPGQCMVVLDSAVPAYASNTIGGQSTVEVPAGTYEVGLAADYGSSLWYGLNGVGEANFINSASASATEGDCSTGG